MKNLQLTYFKKKTFINQRINDTIVAHFLLNGQVKEKFDGSHITYISQIMLDALAIVPKDLSRNFLVEKLSFINQIYQECMLYKNDELEPSIKRIIRKIHSQAPGEITFIPGKWEGIDSSHAVMFIIKKKKFGKLDLIFINTGTGINPYHQVKCNQKGGMHAPNEIFDNQCVFFADIPENEILVDQKKKPCFIRFIITQSKTKEKFTVNKAKNIFYKKLSRFSNYLVDKQHLKKRMVSGFCAYHSLKTAISVVLEKKKYKQLQLIFKTYVLWNYATKNTLDIDQVIKNKKEKNEFVQEGVNHLERRIKKEYLSGILTKRQKKSLMKILIKIKNKNFTSVSERQINEFNTLKLQYLLGNQNEFLDFLFKKNKSLDIDNPLVEKALRLKALSLFISSIKKKKSKITKKQKKSLLEDDYLEYKQLQSKLPKKIRLTQKEELRIFRFFYNISGRINPSIGFDRNIGKKRFSFPSKTVA